jgi:hypothetical protein
MAEFFDSPRLTFIRAQHHIRDLNTVIGDFVNNKPWTYFVDEEPQSGQHVYKIRLTEPVPNMLPCILFDAVNNLRAVLDQSGYASALASGKVAPKKNQFHAAWNRPQHTRSLFLFGKRRWRRNPDRLIGKALPIVLNSMSRIVESVLVATEAECRSLGFQLEE